MGELKPQLRSSRRSGGRVTMATVGRIAGVSQVTVSRALSEPGRVSQDTLTRIHKAIEQTGFVPNAIAGALASQRSHLVTALVPSLTNIVYSSFVKTFSDCMRDAGYQLLLSETGFDAEGEEQAISTHLSRRPDAIMLTGIHHSSQARRMLLGADIPVVEVWDMTDTPIDMCVGFSHAEAARSVADFAYKKNYRIAATVTANDERAHRRCQSFTNRFSALTNSVVIAHNCESSASIGAGRKALADILDNKSFGKGGVIFCSSDALAQGLIVEAHARALRIPHDIAIIGFGDQEFAAHLEPALTTVRVDRNRLGQEAANAVLSRLEDKPSNERKTIDISFEVITRKSA